MKFLLLLLGVAMLNAGVFDKFDSRIEYPKNKKIEIYKNSSSNTRSNTKKNDLKKEIEKRNKAIKILQEKEKISRKADIKEAEELLKSLDKPKKASYGKKRRRLKR
jgi:hypothetical protein